MLLGRSSTCRCMHGGCTVEDPHQPVAILADRGECLELKLLRAGNFAGSQWKLSKMQKFVGFPSYIAFQCHNCLRSDWITANRTWFLSFSVTDLPASHKISWIENGWSQFASQFKRLRTQLQLVSKSVKIIDSETEGEDMIERLTAKTRDRGSSDFWAPTAEMSEPWTSTLCRTPVWHSESTCTWMHSFLLLLMSHPNSILGNGWMGLGALR